MASRVGRALPQGSDSVDGHSAPRPRRPSHPGSDFLVGPAAVGRMVRARLVGRNRRLRCADPAPRRTFWRRCQRSDLLYMGHSPRPPVVRLPPLECLGHSAALPAALGRVRCSAPHRPHHPIPLAGRTRSPLLDGNSRHISMVCSIWCSLTDDQARVRRLAGAHGRTGCVPTNFGPGALRLGADGTRPCGMCPAHPLARPGALSS